MERESFRGVVVAFKPTLLWFNPSTGWLVGEPGKKTDTVYMSLVF